MAGDHGVSDIRFEGFTNGELAQEVNDLRNGPGSESLQNAMEALTTLALGLLATDAVLRDQLQKIGVSWQGVAADGGTSATENARIYAEEAIAPVTDSAGGVRDTTSAFHTTSNRAPESSTLNGPTEETLIDKGLGFLGHTTDHAQQVKETNAARNAAIDAMNGYRDSSADGLNQARTLPVPPGLNLVTTPADASVGMSSVGSSNIGNGFFPGGGSPGGSGTAPLPGVGGGGPGGEVPGIRPAPPVPGGPPFTGGGPFPGNTVIPPGGPLPATLRAANPMLMGEAATSLGSGAASGAGAGAERDRLARTGNPGRGQAARSGVPLGAAPDEEARAARNAERFGARTGKPGSSIMQPAAATGRNAEGEDDKEHVRRYGVDSSDVFDDNRAVAPESIGDDDDDDDR